MKQGEEVWISDGGQKEYRCAIEAFSADEVLLHIIYAQEPDYELPSSFYFFLLKTAFWADKNPNRLSLFNCCNQRRGKTNHTG